jgi:hypothetical protein
MRHEIEPAELGAILSNTFILEASSDRDYAYRLAGTKVCGYFGRELKGEDWLAGWSPESREALSTVLRAIVNDGTGAIVRFVGYNEADQSCPFETLMLPLTNRGAGFTRILGATIPLDQPYWLGAVPITDIVPEDVQIVWPNNSLHFRPPPRKPGLIEAFPLIRRGHLALYEGGRTD